MPLRYNYEPFRRKCYNLQYSVIVVSFARTKHFSLYLLKCLGVHCTCIAIIQYQGKCKHTMLLQSDTIPVWCIFKLFIFSCSVTQNEKVLPFFFFYFKCLGLPYKNHCAYIWLHSRNPTFPLTNGTFYKCCCMATEKGNKFFWGVLQADHEDVQNNFGNLFEAPALEETRIRGGLG